MDWQQAPGSTIGGVDLPTGVGVTAVPHLAAGVQGHQHDGIAGPPAEGMNHLLQGGALAEADHLHQEGTLVNQVLTQRQNVPLRSLLQGMGIHPVNHPKRIATHLPDRFPTTHIMMKCRGKVMSLWSFTGTLGVEH